jgi:hypothetical protein
MLINITPQMRFGMGVDSHTQEVKGKALKFKRVERQQGGQIKRASFEMIESQESLMQDLNISVGASIRYGLAEADARFDFSKQHAVNGYSQYIRLAAYIQNPRQYMVDVELTDDAKATYNRDKEEFRRLYGDCFVDEIYTGGEFYGLVTFETRDETTQEQTGASLRLALGGFIAGGEINASFSEAIKTASRKSRISIDSMTSGGIGLQNATNPAELIDAFRAFGQSAAEHGVEYRASIKEFKYLPLPAGGTVPEEMVRQTTVREAGNRIIEAIKLRSKIQYILWHLEEFKEPNEEALRRQLAELEDRLPKWATVARDCVEDVAKCNLRGLDPIVVNLPDRHAQAPRDPIEERYEQLDQESEVRDRYFKETFLKTPIQQYDVGPRGGRFKLFYDAGQPISGIFWHPQLGAHCVYGPIFKEYYRTGHCGMRNAESLRGYPKTDVGLLAGEWLGANGRNTFVDFERGSLWLDVDSGAISDRFLQRAPGGPGNRPFPIGGGR